MAPESRKFESVFTANGLTTLTINFYKVEMMYVMELTPCSGEHLTFSIFVPAFGPSAARSCFVAMW